MALTHERSDDGEVTLLRVEGTLDAMTAPELMPTVDAIVGDRRARVVVDLSGLELIDSSGVAALVALYKRVRANGGRVSVENARDQPLAIFKLLRMDRVFAMQ